MIGLLVIGALIAGSTTSILATVSPTQTTVINQFSGIDQCSFIVFTDGTDTYAKSCDTGAITYGGPGDAGGKNGASATTVIQAAFDAVPSAGGKVFVKAGNYTISSALKLNSNTLLECEGWSTWLVSQSGSMVILRNTNWSTGNSDITIKNCAFDGKDGTNQDGSITFQNMTRITVQNVKSVHSPGEGIKARTSTFVTFSNNYVEKTANVGGAFKAGLMVSAGGGEVNILGNHAVDTAGEGIGIYYTVGQVNIVGNTASCTTTSSGHCSIHIEGTSVNSQQSENINVVGNTVKSDYYGISVLTSERVMIANNNIKHVGASSGLDGIRVFGASKYISITSNIIDSPSRHGIWVTETTNEVTISDNTIINPNQAVNGLGVGIYLNPVGGSMRDVTITGNNIIDDQAGRTMHYGIYIATGTNQLINPLIANNNIPRGAITAAIGYDLSTTGKITTGTIQNNKGYNPIGLISNPLNNSTNLIGLATEGSSSVFTSTPKVSTDYTVVGTPILLRVTGGTGTSVTIKDQSGNTFASALTSVTAIPVPVGWKINFGGFSGAPTVTVYGM